MRSPAETQALQLSLCDEQYMFSWCQFEIYTSRDAPRRPRATRTSEPVDRISPKTRYTLTRDWPMSSAGSAPLTEIKILQS